MKQVRTKTLAEGADMKIRKGYAHCGYMADKPKEYVKEIEKFMEV